MEPAKKNWKKEMLRGLLWGILLSPISFLIISYWFDVFHCKHRLWHKLENIGGIEVYTANADEIDLMHTMFMVLPKPFVNATKTISIVQDDDCYALEHSKIKAGGHTIDRDICIRRRCFYSGVVVHELTHSYADLHSPQLPKEWDALAGDVYKDKVSYPDPDKDPNAFPQNGILSDYGATNSSEDLAVWVEECYMYLIHGDLNSPLPLVNRSNPIYGRKLHFLLEWGILNETDYQTLRPLVEE